VRYRYAEYDIYGLAASLATSWAVLARSCPDEPQGSYAGDVLHNYVGALQQVRPHAHALRLAILRRPLHDRLRSAQMLGLWCQADESEAWARPPRRALPYYRSTTPAFQRCSSGSATLQSCLMCLLQIRRYQYAAPLMTKSRIASGATGCESSSAPAPAALARAA